MYRDLPPHENGNIAYEIHVRYFTMISDMVNVKAWTYTTYITRQSEMANTSPRHMPVLGNVHPIKIENFDIFRDVISLLARVFILLIDTTTQEVPMKNI